MRDCASPESVIPAMKVTVVQSRPSLVPNRTTKNKPPMPNRQITARPDRHQ